MLIRVSTIETIVIEKTYDIEVSESFDINDSENDPKILLLIKNVRPSSESHAITDRQEIVNVEKL